MEQEQSKIDQTVDNLRDYINTRYELITLQASEKVSGVASNVISGFLIMVLVMLAIVLLSFSAAIYLSSVIGERYSGFLIVGGFYLLVGLFMIFFREKILYRPFRNMIIAQLFKEE